MKLADNPPKVIDEVITEVRAIKRSISERHGNDINRLLDALITQERCAGTSGAEQASAGQPAGRLQSESMADYKPEIESEAPPQ